MALPGYTQAELVEKAHRVLPGGHTGNLALDIVIREGEAGRVRDADGREYVDYLLGGGPMLVGHAHPEVIAAVKERLGKGTALFANNDAAILLAEEIVAAVACAEKVRFTSTGTEATMYAMRAVRAARNRTKILKFEGGFHGMHDAALMNLVPKQRSNETAARPDSAGIPTAASEDVLIAPFNDIEAATQIIAEHHEQLAGVMVEPFQRIIPPLPGFLKGLRAVTEQYGVPLVFDEIVTGFRFAYGGAQAFYGVVPDLCTLGKVIGGGFPLAAVAGSEAIMAHFDRKAVGDDRFMIQIGTLNGNPVASTAGLATLAILKRPGTYDGLFRTGRRLMAGLQHLLRDAGLPGQVVGEGALFDIVFSDQPITNYWSVFNGDRPTLLRFNALLLEHGVFKAETKYYVSTAHDEADVELTLKAFAAAIDALAADKSARKPRVSAATGSSGRPAPR